MILKKEEFSMWVENSKIATKESYIDNVLLACERFNVEIELVQPLLTDQIVLKIRAEAIKRNIIKSSTKSLKAFI
jgi:hypothetical protein